MEEGSSGLQTFHVSLDSSRVIEGALRVSLQNLNQFLLIQVWSNGSFPILLGFKFQNARIPRNLQEFLRILGLIRLFLLTIDEERDLAFIDQLLSDVSFADVNMNDTYCYYFTEEFGNKQLKLERSDRFHPTLCTASQKSISQSPGSIGLLNSLSETLMTISFSWISILRSFDSYLILWGFFWNSL